MENGTARRWIIASFAAICSVFSATGQPASGRSPAVGTSTARLGPRVAPVLYLGTVPGVVAAGELEIRVPAGLREGEYSVQVEVNGVLSNPATVVIGGAH